LTQSTDEELLIEIGTGDKGSLEQLYRRHGLHLAALVTRIFDDRQLAEEVVQDTFLAVWNGARFDGRSRVRTWLVAIAIRQARSRRRKHRFSVGSQSTDLVSNEPDPESATIAGLEAARMVDELSALTSLQREVLLLTFVEELTQPEIAELLGVRLGTVKSRMHSAKSAMKRTWRQGDGE
jgi:RNA polymerase sigma factor (sigma-70 family)